MDIKDNEFMPGRCPSAIVIGYMTVVTKMENNDPVM